MCVCACVCVCVCVSVCLSVCLSFRPSAIPFSSIATLLFSPLASGSTSSLVGIHINSLIYTRRSENHGGAGTAVCSGLHVSLTVMIISLGLTDNQFSRSRKQKHRGVATIQLTLPMGVVSLCEIEGNPLVKILATPLPSVCMCVCT